MKIILALLTVLTAAEKPNILLIVSDDQGYVDAGFQGGANGQFVHDWLQRDLAPNWWRRSES